MTVIKGEWIIMVTNTKEYYKKYYQDHKEQYRKYGLDHREQNKVTSRNWKQKMRRKCLNLIGNKCQICNSIEKIRFHEIHGKKHETGTTYILKQYKDFVPLCLSCHNDIHRFIRKKQLSIMRLTEILEMLKGVIK